MGTGERVATGVPTGTGKRIVRDAFTGGEDRHLVRGPCRAARWRDRPRGDRGQGTGDRGQVVGYGPGRLSASGGGWPRGGKSAHREKLARDLAALGRYRGRTRTRPCAGQTALRTRSRGPEVQRSRGPEGREGQGAGICRSDGPKGRFPFRQVSETQAPSSRHRKRCSTLEGPESSSDDPERTPDTRGDQPAPTARKPRSSSMVRTIHSSDMSSIGAVKETATSAS